MDNDHFKIVMAVIVLVSLGIGAVAFEQAIKRVNPPYQKIPLALHNEEKAIEDYLKSQGALYPEAFAAACMETTNPALCAAMVLRESTANIAPPNGAHGEVGPWQIIPANWRWLVGEPSRDIWAASTQWDLIMVHLQEKTHSLPAAIGAYNGNGDGYVAYVWKHYRRMEM